VTASAHLHLPSVRAAAGEIDITHCGERSYRGMPMVQCALHDQLRARLLLLSGPEGEALWISADECTFRSDSARYIRDTLAQKGGISANHILLAGTHTHAAHNYPSFNADAFAVAVLHVLPELRVRLRTVARSVVRLAHTPPDTPVINRRVGFGPLGEHCCMFNDDCRVDVASGRLEVAHLLAAEAHRLGTTLAQLGLPTADIWADGPVDDRLHLATLQDTHGEVIASIGRVNAHAVVATQSRVGAIVSADFIRPLEDVIRQATAGAPCLIFNGAFGDTRPLQREYSTAEAQRIGQTWATAMLAAPATECLSPTLSLATRDERLPLREDLPHDRNALMGLQATLTQQLTAHLATPLSLDHAIERKRLEGKLSAIAVLLLPPPPTKSGILTHGELESGAVSFELQAWRLGQLGLMAFGGEPFVRLAQEIEQHSGLLVVGAAGSYASYLLDPDSCAGGSYEATECLFGPATLARLPELAASVATGAAT